MSRNLQRFISLVLLFSMLIVQFPVVRARAEGTVEEPSLLLEETQAETEVTEPETEETAETMYTVPETTEPTETPTEQTEAPTEFTEAPTEPTHPDETTESTEPTQVETIPEEQALQAEEQIPEEYPDFMEIPDDLSPEVADPYDSSGHFAIAPEGLPSRYDSRESGWVTSVKHQGSYNLCWAFSALAVGESWLISRGWEDESVDLSERHLGYYSDGNAYDPLGNATGDSSVRLTGDYIKTGFNNKYTTFLMANWIGAAAESAYPYNKAPSGNDASAVDDVFHMTNAYWINAQSDKDNMKRYIQSNGAIGLSFHYEKTALNYNSTNAAYYSTGFTQTNHAITVIGWDDEYPKSNFSTEPPEDGAWLCKNSHGTTFGKDGYFWLSYYDSAINLSTSTAFVFEFEPADTYDRNYHYDGAYGIGSKNISSGGSVANVFTAAGSEEELRAVGIGLYSTNVEYSIQIYKNLTDPACPTSGTPVLSEPQHGQTYLGGYYTIELDEYVTLKSGETFAVVFTLSKADGSDVSLFVDQNSESSWIRFTTRTERNQSFSCDAGKDWSDLSVPVSQKDKPMTARIKAYTVVTNFIPAEGLRFETESEELIVGENFSQRPKVLPENAALCTLNWSSSNRSVATVDGSGKVTALSFGQARITATISGTEISASYQVTVKPTVQSVRILSRKTQMVAGETDSPKAEILPAAAAPYYTLSITSSDENVAAVTGNEIRAVAPGKTIIRICAGDAYAEYTLRVCVSLADAQITVAEMGFLGTAIRPPVTVVLGSQPLKEGVDYNLSYMNNNRPGTGTVKVTGIGDYAGTASASFPVQIPVPTLRSAENENSGIRVTWDAISGAGGYYLYRRSGTAAWKKIASISGDTKSDYLDRASLTSGTLYEYRICTRVGSTYVSEFSEIQSLYRLTVPSISKVAAEANGFRVTWREVSRADAYCVLRSENGAPAVEIGRVEAMKNPGFLDTTPIDMDVRYTYTVRALKGTDDEMTESAESASRSICLPAPVELTGLQNDTGGVTLRWGKSAVATGYQIFRSTDAARWSKVKTVSSGSELSWTDTRSSSGVRYYYRIQVCAKLDGVTYLSENSQAKSIVWVAPPRIKTIAKTDAGFEMTWAKVTGAESYRIARRTQVDGDEEIQWFDAGTALRFMDSTATQTDITYEYYVTALRQEDTSALSKAARACNPQTPELLSVRNASKGIELRWEQVTLSTGYIVYRSTNGVSWSKVRTVSNGKALSWTDTGARAGVRYLYRVESTVKLDGVTYRSNPSETMATARLAMPVIQKVTVLEKGGCQVVWKKVTGADGYLLMRSEDDRPPVLVATIEGIANLQYLDASADAYDTKYTYTVIAFIQQEQQIQSFSSAGKSTCRLSAPILNSVVVDGRNALVQWEKSPIAQGYRVYRSTDGRSWSLRKTIYSGDILSWTDTSRSTGKTYYYRVVATGKLDGVTFISLPSNEIQQ